MISRRVKVQLLVFTIVTVLSVGYAATRFFSVDELVSPPYEVAAEFDHGGGIFPRADVEVLGTRVGRVEEVRPGPAGGTTVVMTIDADVTIPTDVHASVGSKSAIGEQYVQLAPRSAGGRPLADGDVIPRSQTSSPIEVQTLLRNLDSFAGSVDTRDMGIVLDELSTALEGTAPTIGRLVDEADTLTRNELAHAQDQVALIKNARTVLDTQVDKARSTRTFLREWAGLLNTLRVLSPDFADLYARGSFTSREVTRLLAGVGKDLGPLLTNLITLTAVANAHLPGFRKVLTLLPWALELGASTIRYCDEVDPRTGKPVAATCHYDGKGRPVYASYMSDQLFTDNPMAYPCTRGYEDTVKYYPDGTPMNGGPRQRPNSPTNMDAACTAPPDDPRTPNVRGAQNAQGH
jgi:phospholipid/cholesterol/gamma-HCH transport system substrate-binding protein